MQLELDSSILYTPLADFSISDECEKIPFDLIPYYDTSATVYLDNDAHKEYPLEKYTAYKMSIHTDNLEIGKIYHFCTTSPLEYRDSDERLFTLGKTSGKTLLAVSFPDPNDDIKCECPLHYEEMCWYDFNYTGDQYSPVSFQLLDRKKKFIIIAVAWCWDVVDHTLDYESAIEVVTWIV